MGVGGMDEVNGNGMDMDGPSSMASALAVTELLSSLGMSPPVLNPWLYLPTPSPTPYPSNTL